MGSLQLHQLVVRLSEQLGATPRDWWNFDVELGLGAHLLPCVPAQEGLRFVEGSSITGKAGKIPSSFNASGEVHGLKEWNKREILPAEIQAWSRDRRLNICLRTGDISAVHALDVDVDDPVTADKIAKVIEAAIGVLPKRVRSNSGKFLLLFKLVE